MNRRKQNPLRYDPKFYDRRKRWGDRRVQSRWWGLVAVPYILARNSICFLFGLNYEKR